MNATRGRPIRLQLAYGNDIGYEGLAMVEPCKVQTQRNLAGVKNMSDLGFSAAPRDDAYRWFVVHAQPHGEFRAAGHLSNQGFPTFLPLCRKTVRHARQFRTKEAPFFPRYLFVELAIGRDRWRSVNGTFGVSHLIMEGERPTPVPPGIVERLIAAADARGVITMEPTLRPGQTVRIVTGPFAGTVGELACLNDCGRVRVLLELMGSVVTVSATGVGVVPAMVR